jgi:hypothetical protein
MINDFKVLDFSPIPDEKNHSGIGDDLYFKSLTSTGKAGN